MRRVIIESPYAGDVEHNLRYLRAAMHDCLVNHNEAPIASHALYTQPGVLDDLIPSDRQLGITAGHEWWDVADDIIFYVDLGWSPGMLVSLERAGLNARKIVERKLGDSWDTPKEPHQP